MNQHHLQDFLSYVTVKKGLAANSIKHVRIRYRIFFEWLGKNNISLSKEAVERFFLYLRHEKRLRNNSLNTYVFFFRYLQDYLRDRGILINIAGELKSFNKEQAFINVLNIEEIRKILKTHLTYGKFNRFTAAQVTEYYDFMYLTLTEFLATTGCRYEEAAGLKLEHLNLSLGKATFMLTKNHENRIVDLSSNLINKLKLLVRGKTDKDLVFTNILGKKVHAQSYIEDIKRRAKAAGLTKRIYPHLFRHSFATQLLKDGVDITMVATILGHKDIQTTFENYIHLASDQIRKAMFRHQLLRSNIQPDELLQQIKNDFEKYRLDDDKRFNFEIVFRNGELKINVVVNDKHSNNRRNVVK